MVGKPHGVEWAVIGALGASNERLDGRDKGAVGSDLHGEGSWVVSLRQQPRGRGLVACVNAVGAVASSQLSQTGESLMESSELLIDGLARVSGVVQAVLGGDLSQEELMWRPDAEANSVAWLVWHLARVEDHHVADLAGIEQVWITDDFAARFVEFGVDPDEDNVGYGHTADEVATVAPDVPALLDYHGAVHEMAISYVATVDADELGRIIDTSYDPPVSVGVRLISVLSDCLQHAGQAAYLRGLMDRME